MRFRAIQPTVFLRAALGLLQQRIQVSLQNDGPPTRAILETRHNKETGQKIPLTVPTGISSHDCFLQEITTPADVDFLLYDGDRCCDRRKMHWSPPRHWTVHVTQISHHDVGYTDLASHVLNEHDCWLDDVIDMVALTRRFPEDDQFRIVVEQAWSIDHYLKHASPARTRQMIRLMQSGHVEITALFGNLITELCGHETLARALYPSMRLRRKYGISLVSAEHNDIPGFTWGLSEVLIEAGIKMFCPGLPLYYGWGGDSFPSFWDEELIFGYSKMPGAFWWESPSGKRLLFWSNNQGCGGDCRGNLPGLADRLQELSDKNYPYNLLRWPVLGGARDNSPYIVDYAKSIHDWNRKWVFPHLICSTNTRFYDDFVQQVDLLQLPVRRGDMPGQDYPVGSTSTAAATAVNRNNHVSLAPAESLATIAAQQANHPYPKQRIDDSVEEILWHDEHTWGHHFPAGPTAQTAELEKAVHAHRASALLHDVASKALARIADAVQLETDDLHLVVFNPLPYERSEYVRTPLRETDNCGSEMIQMPPSEDPAGSGYLQAVLLNHRWHLNPTPEIIQGKFDLVDTVTGDRLLYQIVEMDSSLGPEPYAAQRIGLAANRKRYGLFELPVGLKRTLYFRVNRVPAMGYRTYRLVRREDAPVFDEEVTVTDTTLENRFYRIDLSPDTGFVQSLIDKTKGREWVDREAPHPFGAVVVCNDAGEDILAQGLGVKALYKGPCCAAIRSLYEAPGHPILELTIVLHTEDRNIEFSLGMLKDPTPRLESHLAFPFALKEGAFTYEGPFCAYDPGNDRLPGAYANRLTVQNWAKATDGQDNVFWTSLDAPIVSLGRLWPTRVSPAHSCVLPLGLDRPSQSPEDLSGGLLYSCLTNNNFGTNFAVSQCGALLFRYILTTQSEACSLDPALFGAAAVTPFHTLFTQGKGTRFLPPVQGFLELSNPALQMTAFKQAEDGEGLILRLWNPDKDAQETTIRLPGTEIKQVEITSLMEEGTTTVLTHSPHQFQITVPAKQCVTIRIRVEEEER